MDERDEYFLKIDGLYIEPLFQFIFLMLLFFISYPYYNQLIVILNKCSQYDTLQDPESIKWTIFSTKNAV